MVATIFSAKPQPITQNVMFFRIGGRCEGLAIMRGFKTNREAKEELFRRGYSNHGLTVLRSHEAILLENVVADITSSDLDYTFVPPRSIKG